MSTPPHPLTRKLAIITGASRGIGAAIALNLAHKGVSHLLLSYSSPASTSATAALVKEIRSINPHVDVGTCQADVGSVDGPAAIVTAALELAPTIDIIINNAGVSYNRYLGEITTEDFERQYNVNVRGPLLLVQLAKDHLPTNRSGRIVNVSSVSAALGFKAQSVYGGTKAALDAMTRTWARELSSRCTVNSINPGPVDTRMYAGTSPEFQENMRPFIEATPLAEVSEQAEGLTAGEFEEIKKSGGRAASVDEVAAMVGLLCLPDAAWCTGQVVSANGGMIFGTC